MTRIVFFVFALAALLTVAGATHPASASAPAKRAFILLLDQSNDSGLRGKATLTQIGNDVMIVVDLGAELPDFYKSYIAEGTCDGHIFDFIYDLAPFHSGVSKTKIRNASVDALMNDGTYMIAVPNGACGDLAAARPRR